MLKERLKSSAIFLLIVNLLFITFEIWFVHNSTALSENMLNYIRSVPAIRFFFPEEPAYSFPKENLARPRKFLINDGSLWMAYYNTDIGFSPIEERTREIIKGFLDGDIINVKKVDNKTWEAGLESYSIYVEYPISFSPQVFCRVMDSVKGRISEKINTVKDFVILPSIGESNVCLLVRDFSDKDNVYAYMLSNKYELPSTDLEVYTGSGDGYYEPAFSTGLLLGSESTVELSPLVLFSDSQPDTDILTVNSLINSKSSLRLLEAFSFNPTTANSYTDNSGALNFIENYASVKIYPDSLIEYSSVSSDKGLLLDSSADAYNVLNASIDFAEKIWKCVSREQLNVLVTSNLDEYRTDAPYTLRFDYYCNGRPVEIELADEYGHKKMNCAIEMTVLGGRLISYRHYVRSYKYAATEKLSEAFLPALDSFVHQFEKRNVQNNVISDIFIGYLDNGKSEMLNAGWLAADESGKIYSVTEMAVKEQ